MWLSQNVKFGGESRHSTAEVGSISIGGTSLAVVTQNEQRNLKMALQNGYYWLPNIGDKVLVITSDDGEPIVIGVIPTQAPEVSAGELLISDGSSSISLDGSGVSISANVINIDGNLKINGQTYIPYTGGII